MEKKLCHLAVEELLHLILVKFYPDEYVRSELEKYLSCSFKEVMKELEIRLENTTI